MVIGGGGTFFVGIVDLWEGDVDSVCMFPVIHFILFIIGCIA